MPIVVRGADVDSDREVLLSTLKRHMSLGDERRYDWLYVASPFGRARTWLAFDGAEAVGVAAAFPRPMLVSGQQRTGCVLGDFCISERHRSLGPALQLQKECLAGTRTGEYAFCYDFPSQPMAAVYQRLGMKPTRSILRLTKPLRLGKAFLGRVRSARIASTLGRITDILLRYVERRSRSACEFSEHCGRFGEEFTALATELGREYTICTFRSATYLNWRYRDHPFRTYRVITARTGRDQLAGYIVFCHDAELATIVDLVSERDPEVLQGLVLSAALQLRSEGAKRLDFPLIRGCPWIPAIRHIGFFVRKGSPVIIYAGRGETSSVPDKLLLVAGDRES